MLSLPTTEAFTFLNLWRDAAGLPPPSVTDDDDASSCFDLHFTLPPQNDDVDHPPHNNEDSESDCEVEFKFALSPSNPTDPHNPSLSPSQLLLHDLDLNPSEPSSKPRFHASSLFKPATRFRVFISSLRKSKSNIVTSQQPKQESQTRSPSSASEEKRLHKYLKMVKPLYVKVSRRYAEKGQLNMSSSAAPPSSTASKKPSPSEAVAVQHEGDSSGAAFGGAGVKGQKQRNMALTAGLRVVCKHLGKSRSAAETVADSAPTAVEFVSSKRRDDSLMQQHDGIQSAILHCKSSFNASTESESSRLPQCVTNPLHETEISPELASKSTSEGESKQRVLFSNVSLMHSVKIEKENATT